MIVWIPRHKDKLNTKKVGHSEELGTERSSTQRFLGQKDKIDSIKNLTNLQMK